MFDFPEIIVIPLGDWINTAVEWLTINLPLYLTSLPSVLDGLWSRLSIFCGGYLGGR